MEQTKMAEVEQAMEALKKENTKENMTRLMQTMEACDFFMPAVLPPDTDPKLMKQIVQNSDRQMPIPQGVSPRPAVLENKEGKRFLSLFTSEEQLAKGEQKHPLTLVVPFSSCMKLVQTEESIAGIVINAFDHNITLNVNHTKKEAPETREVTLTQAQLHAVIRQHVESTVLPGMLFEQKWSGIEALKAREGEVFLELYEALYPQEVTCPYEAEEFEVMALNIRNDLTILQITMPEQKLVPGTCPMVLTAWNPVKETIRYFGVVKGKQGEENHMIEAMKDGNKKDWGVAPVEGSELQYLLDLCQEK